MKNSLLLFFMGLFFLACTSEEKTKAEHSHENSTVDHAHDHHHGHEHGEGYKKEHTGSFDKHGIGFSIPKDWSILEGEIPGGGQYVSIEKIGDDESGRYSISILPGNMTIEQLMEAVKTQMQDGMKPTGNDVAFTKNQKTIYNGLETISCKHSFINQGLAFDGLIRVFNCEDKVINMISIGAQADLEKNKSGFELIDKTFVCKK